MIKLKEKICKGQGVTLGYGCGKLTMYRVHGLCKMNCYVDWLLNSENGKIKFNKSLLKATDIVKKYKAKESREYDKETKIKLMSTDKYRATYLQPIINEIARLIDYGQPCIATGNYGKENGGHYVSVGANRTTALNLHNIHIQSFESNHFKSGDPIKYRLGLIKTYGNDYFEFVEFLQKHKPLHLNKSELIEITLRASFLRSELKRNTKIRTSLERIELRNEINLKLGIYDIDFCKYNSYLKSL